MPKKKLGTHPKAVEARERKANQKSEEEARRQKEVEDEYWKDENKALKRKEERKVSRLLFWFCNPPLIIVVYRTETTSPHCRYTLNCSFEMTALPTVFALTQQRLCGAQCLHQFVWVTVTISIYSY